MSVQSELTRLQGYVDESYEAVDDCGGTVPTDQTMVNLPDAIDSIPPYELKDFTGISVVDSGTVATHDSNVLSVEAGKVYLLVLSTIKESTGGGVTFNPGVMKIRSFLVSSKMDVEDLTFNHSLFVIFRSRSKEVSFTAAHYNKYALCELT